MVDTVEKALGEAVMRVKGTAQGEGVEAYMQRHQWRTMHTAMTMQELGPHVVGPTQAHN